MKFDQMINNDILSEYQSGIEINQELIINLTESETMKFKVNKISKKFFIPINYELFLTRMHQV